MQCKDEVLKVEWECVHFIRKGFFKDGVAEWRETLEDNGFLLFELPSEKISGDYDLFEKVGGVMSFPDYFGNNWNALYDCMTDMMWLPAKGYVLVIQKAEEIWKDDPMLMGKFLECWLGAAGFWAEQKVPYHLIFVR